MKRVRTKSSDIAGNMEPPKKSKETTNGKRSPSPKAKRTATPPLPIITNGIDKKTKDTKFSLKIITHGRVNGEADDPEEGEEMLNFSVRDVPNPPAKLRKNFTGLSSRLRKEIFTDKLARQKYDTMVIEIEKMMDSMEVALKYDADHPEEVDEPTATVLIVSIQSEEGKHRSVSYAEELAQSTKRKDWGIHIEHRDLGVGQADGTGEDDDSEELPSPTGIRKESVKSKKKKDKNMKKQHDRRLHIEYVGSGAEDGFL